MSDDDLRDPEVDSADVAADEERKGISPLDDNDDDEPIDLDADDDEEGGLVDDEIEPED